VPRKASDPTEDAWLLYRETIPQHERERLKELVLEASLNGFESFLDTTMAITAEIIAGNVHPAVAREARAYLELAMAAVTAKVLQDKADRSSGKGEVSARLSAVRQKTNKTQAALTIRPDITIDIETTEKEPARVRADAPWEEK
jgi:hypothetical protein